MKILKKIKLALRFQIKKSLFKNSKKHQDLFKKVKQRTL